MASNDLKGPTLDKMVDEDIIKAAVQQLFSF
jgi:hypothetical protein